MRPFWLPAARLASPERGPPYVHQGVNVDGEFLLLALATGLIANALLNGY